MFAHVFIICMYFLGMRAMHIILAIKCPLPTCYICIDVPLLQHQTSCGHVINIYMYICLEMQDKNIKLFSFSLSWYTACRSIEQAVSKKHLSSLPPAAADSVDGAFLSCMTVNVKVKYLYCSTKHC